MGFSTPSTGKACGASPLRVASLAGRPLHPVVSCGDTPPKTETARGVSPFAYGEGVQIAFRSFFPTRGKRSSPRSFFPTRGKRSSPRSFFQRGENDPWHRFSVVSEKRSRSLHAVVHSAINGARRPLRQHKPPESPPSRSLALAGIELDVANSGIRRPCGLLDRRPAGIPSGRVASRF